MIDFVYIGIGVLAFILWSFVASRKSKEASLAIGDLLWRSVLPFYWLGKLSAFRQADPEYRVSILSRFKKRLLFYWYALPLVWFFFYVVNFIVVMLTEFSVRADIPGVRLIVNNFRPMRFVLSIPQPFDFILIGGIAIALIVLFWKRYSMNAVGFMKKVVDFFIKHEEGYEKGGIHFEERGMTFEQRRENLLAMFSWFKANGKKALIVAAVMFLFSAMISEWRESGVLKLVLPLPVLLAVNESYSVFPVMASWLAGNFFASRFATKWMVVINFPNHLSQAMVAMQNPAIPGIQPKPGVDKNNLIRIPGQIDLKQWYIPNVKTSEPGLAMMDVTGFPLPLEYFFKRQAELEASMNCRLIGIFHDVEPSKIFFLYTYDYNYLTRAYFYDEVPAHDDPLCFYIGRAGSRWIEQNWEKTPHVAIAGMTGYGKTTAINHFLLGSLNGMSVVILCDATGGVDFSSLKYRPDKLEELQQDFLAGKFNDKEYSKRREQIEPIPCCVLARDQNQIIAIINWAYGEMQKRILLLQENPQTSNIRDFLNPELFGNNTRDYGTIFIFCDETASGIALGSEKSPNQFLNVARYQLQEVIRVGRKFGIRVVLAAQRPSHANFGDIRAQLNPIAAYIDRPNEVEMHFGYNFPMPNIPGVVAMRWHGGIVFVKMPITKNQKVAEYAWEKVKHLSSDNWEAGKFTEDQKRIYKTWLDGMVALEVPPEKTFRPEVIAQKEGQIAAA